MYGKRPRGRSKIGDVMEGSYENTKRDLPEGRELMLMTVQLARSRISRHQIELRRLHVDIHSNV